MDATYFPEGVNRSCSLFSSMKLESSSIGSGSGTPCVHFEGQNFQDEEDVVCGDEGAVACQALEKKPPEQVLSLGFGRFLHRFSHGFAFLFYFVCGLLDFLTQMKSSVIHFILMFA